MLYQTIIFPSCVFVYLMEFKIMFQNLQVLHRATKFKISNKLVFGESVYNFMLISKPKASRTLMTHPGPFAISTILSDIGTVKIQENNVFYHPKYILKLVITKST